MSLWPSVGGLTWAQCVSSVALVGVSAALGRWLDQAPHVSPEWLWSVSLRPSVGGLTWAQRVSPVALVGVSAALGR